MRKILVSLCFIALAIALPASAQVSPKSVGEIYVIKTKPSMSAQWEAGMKKLIAWSKQQNRPATYYGWSIISGPRTGQYVLGTFGHDWKDFDAINKPNSAAGKIVQEDMSPYTESVRTSYWAYREDLNGPPPSAGQGPTAFSAVYTFFFKPATAMGSITDTLKQVRAAMKKSHWPGNPGNWYSLVNGGYGPTMVVGVGHLNWAGFQPPDPSLGKMLSEVYGQAGAGAIFKTFYGSVRAIRSEIWAYRPDLSYIAASQ